MVMIGCFAGTIIGMLPGLGPMTAIALMIPITYGFEPSTGLILMAGVYYGAVFGGSTSSILINAPGIPGTVATSFDGYPMAQQGKAGKALAIAAYSSFAGGTIAAIFLLIAGFFLPPVAVIVMTSAILLPVITQLGFDPYWFAIVFTINMEIGLITPPVGLNLYIIKGITPDVS